MAKEQVVVPDIGGAEGAEVIEVLVAVGDEVSLEQSLIVLESDKASMEIPCTVAGTVIEVLAEVGKELSEGDPIVLLETAADSASESQANSPVASAPETITEIPPEPPAQSNSETPGVVASQGIGAASSGVMQTQHKSVAVPDIGTDEAVDLIEVCIAVGDVVAKGDSLVVLETDKASMEVPAPLAGKVIKVLVSEGGTVRQGDELAILEAEEPTAEAPVSNSAVPTSTGQTSAAQAPALKTDKAPAQSLQVAATAPATSTLTPIANGESVHAGPAVRKLAREFGLDLNKVSGSGPRARILKEDLHSFVKKSISGEGLPVSVGTGIPAIPEVDFAAFGEVEVEPLSKIGKLTAANMQRSWLNVPHVTQFDNADITDLEAFRAEMKVEGERRGVKLTPLPFMLKAVAVALRDNPKFRASLSADGQSLVYKQYTHIGIAVDTPAGLVVPVLRDVDQKSIWQLAEEVVSLAGKARDRKLSLAEMQGGCFTISSLGNIGGTGFTPIVNAPEVGILGVSKATIGPVWNGTEFAPRKLLPLGLSYDHRVINGGDAGRFLTELVALLSDIRRLAL